MTIDAIRPSMAQHRGALLLLALCLLSGSLARTILSPLQELARIDLGLSYQQMGLLQGLALAAPIALLSISVGRLVDGSNRVRLLFALACCWTIGTVLTAVATSFVMILAARALTGLGIAGSLAAAASLAADLSSPTSRGRTMMLLAIGQAVGSGVAFGAGGTLVGSLSDQSMAAWRLVLLVIAGTLAVTTALLLLLREPARQELGRPAGGSLRSAWPEIRAHGRMIACLIVGMTTIAMADAAAAIWAVPVLTHEFALTPTQFGQWLGATLTISGVLGVLLGGFLADYGQRRARGSGLLAGTVAGALCSALAAFFPVMHSTASFAMLLGLLMFCGGVIGVIATTAIALLLPNEIRGLCMSVANAVATFVGLGLAPLAVTLIAGDATTGSSIAPALTLVGVATSIVGALAFLFALLEARRRDLNS